MAPTRLTLSSYAGLTVALLGLASYRFYERQGAQDPPSKAQVVIGTVVQGLSQAHYLPQRWYQVSVNLYVRAPFYAQAAALAALVAGFRYVAATGAAPFIYNRF